MSDAPSPPPANDNPDPAVWRVPILGTIHDDGTFVRNLRPPALEIPAALIERYRVRRPAGPTAEQLAAWRAPYPNDAHPNDPREA